MFPVRLMFILLSTTMVFYELALGGVPNDRISLILSEITAVNNKVGALAEKTVGIEKKVDTVAGHVLKLESEMNDVLKSEDKLKNQVSNVENQVKNVKFHVADVKSSVAQVEEMVNVAAKGWTFLGVGVYGHVDHAIDIKVGTTLQECVQIYATGK